MAKLAIDLQEGFADDEVRIFVNGRQVYHQGGVTTRLLLGLADSWQDELPAGPVEVRVKVESKRIEQRVHFDLGLDTYVGAALIDETLRLRVSETPFGYG